MSLAALRARMVADQLEARGVRDPRVLQAMGRVPRERFVEQAMRERAYEDGPLPIGGGQTISQPYMVAKMLELVAPQPSERLLEIGAGCGYLAAVAAELAREVYAVELRADLSRSTGERLSSLGVRNVILGCFDGTHGWPEHAPYDVIVVSAGAPSIPAMLVDELGEGGRLVVPVGPRQGQRLALVHKRDGEYSTEWSTPCMFVDLLGRYGWSGDGPARA
jgi:protein-L-isoaspartate(D-aspartate) O-methyltransferase